MHQRPSSTAGRRHGQRKVPASESVIEFVGRINQLDASAGDGAALSSTSFLSEPMPNDLSRNGGAVPPPGGCMLSSNDYYGGVYRLDLVESTSIGYPSFLAKKGIFL